MRLPSTRALRAAGATALVLTALTGTVIVTDPATGPSTSGPSTVVQTRVVTTARTVHLPAEAAPAGTGSDDEGFEGDDRD